MLFIVGINKTKQGYDYTSTTIFLIERKKGNEKNNCFITM